MMEEESGDYVEPQEPKKGIPKAGMWAIGALGMFFCILLLSFGLAFDCNACISSRSATMTMALPI